MASKGVQGQFGVEHQLHVGAHRVARRAHRGHVGLVQLEHAEPLGTKWRQAAATASGVS